MKHYDKTGNNTKICKSSQFFLYNNELILNDFVIETTVQQVAEHSQFSAQNCITWHNIQNY